jgi:hypothetical protein
MIVSWLKRAWTVSLRGLVAFGKFWYGFIIGDDWTVAAAVAIALVVTWLLHIGGVAAWWLVPMVAVIATGASLRRTSRTGFGTRRGRFVQEELGDPRLTAELLGHHIWGRLRGTPK